MVQQPVKQDSEGINIGSRIRLRKTILLGRRKSLRSKCNGIRFVFRMDTRNAEINQHGPAIRADHDILWLNVPMNNGWCHAMQGGKLVAELYANANDLFL